MLTALLLAFSICSDPDTGNVHYWADDPVYTLYDGANADMAQATEDAFMAWVSVPRTVRGFSSRERDREPCESIVSDVEGEVHEIRADGSERRYRVQASTVPPYCLDGLNLVHFEGDLWPFEKGALGVTVNWPSPVTGAMIESDVFINGVDFQWSWDFSPGTYDLLTVMTHEVGHVWGICHSEDKDALMYPFVASQENKRDLGEDDIAAYEELYLPADRDPRPPDCRCGVGGSAPLLGNILPFFVTVLTLLRRRRT